MPDLSRNEEANRLASGELAQTESRAIVRRWILALSERRERIRAERGSKLPGATAVDLRPAAGAPADYSAVLDEFLARGPALAEEVSCERAQAENLFAELHAHPPGRQLTMIQNQRRFRSWALVERLLGEVRAQRRREPRLALELARLAESTAALIEPGALTSRSLALLRLEIQGEIGNGLRINGHLVEAEGVLHAAMGEVYDFPDEPALQGRLLSYMSSLCNDQGHYREAARVGLRAAACFRRAGDRHHEGKAWMNLAEARAQEREFFGALRALEKARSRVDIDREPWLVWAVHQNAATLLADTGDYAQAAKLLPTCYRCFAAAGLGERDRPDLLWLTGRIQAGLGQEEMAEATWIEAREGFRRLGLTHWEVLISLEIAALLAEQKRYSEVRTLAESIVPILASKGIERDAVAALTLFVESARAEEVQVAAIRQALRTISGRRTTLRSVRE